MSKQIIDLTGPEGNVFALIGKARSLAKQLGIDNYSDIRDDMMTGDYEHALEVFERHFGDYVELTGR